MRELDFLARHFDIAVESPDSIKKLRGLILQLAVMGKLVPQDPNDAPASELLKEIEAEKARLTKEGKIKNNKSTDENIKIILPCELPDGWIWASLLELGFFIGGKTPSTNKSQYWNGSIPWVSAKDMKSLYIDDSEDHITQDGLNSGLILIPPKSILMVVRSGILRRTFPVAINTVPCTINQDLKALLPFMKIYSDYILLMLRGFENYILTKLSKTGMTVESIVFDEFIRQKFPLPPLAEQKRIVEKIDQLMALCDKLEAEKAARDRKRAALHAAAMNRLLGAPDGQAFAASWNFIAQHFGALYSTAENVADLKKAILQLAVMGKLVPQNPNDQPASELLKEIEAEKARLAREGKIKKQEPLPPVRPEEIPFDLPKGWEWVRLGDTTSKITDGDHKTPPRITKGYRLLSAKNVRDGFIDYDNCDFISKEHYLNSRKRCHPEIGDLLIVSVGGTIGRTSLIQNDSNFALVRSVALIKPLKMNSQYLRHVMNSELLQSTINTKKRGGAQPCLYLSEIELFLTPLPPLAEQKRIVEKIDHLMALCDSLERQIAGSTEKKSSILDAVLATM